MKKKSKVLEESEDLELEAGADMVEEGQHQPEAAGTTEDLSLLGQMKKIQEQLFYLERKVDQILERNSGGGGGRRDFGGGAPRRDFRSGGDRPPRREFGGGGGGDFGGNSGGGDRDSAPKRTFGGGDSSPRQWNRKD